MDDGRQLPTYRLYVKHGFPLESQKERELRKLFESTGGQVTHFVTRPEWRNSLVSFATTEEAVRAKEKLEGESFRGHRLSIEFTRPSARVVVRGLPRGMRPATVVDAVRRASNGRVLRAEHYNTWHGGDDWTLVFGSVEDARALMAQRSVVVLNNCPLCFDFDKDRTRHSRRSPSPREQRRVLFFEMLATAWQRI